MLDQRLARVASVTPGTPTLAKARRGVQSASWGQFQARLGTWAPEAAAIRRSGHDFVPPLPAPGSRLSAPEDCLRAPDPRLSETCGGRGRSAEKTLLCAEFALQISRHFFPETKLLVAIFRAF